MKKWLDKIVIFLILILAASCSTDMADNSNNKQINQQESESNVESKQIKYCEYIAYNKIQELSASEGAVWNKNSKITKHYPVYMPGIEEPAYYEFKVETNGVETGYVLVSTTEADIQVPELSTQGKTPTELYIEKTGVTNLSMIRYNHFSSIAVAGDLGQKSSKNSAPGLYSKAGTSENNKILATIGVGGNGLSIVKDAQQDVINKEVANINKEFVASIKNNGCHPDYDKEGLKNYYQKHALTVDEKVLDPNSVNRCVSTPVKLPYVISEKAELRYMYGHGFRTPTWAQTFDYYTGNGVKYPVGCGPTAWAIVYGYWDEFKGKSKLFGTGWKPSDQLYEIYPAPAKAAMDYLRVQLGTFHGGDVFSNTWGATWPVNMVKGNTYAEHCGYSASVSVKYFTDWTGCMSFAWEEIKADRPLVLYYAPKAGSLHYGVVEGVTRRYWSNTSAATELGLLVNYGWGTSTKKWIYAFTDTNKNVTASYELYSLNIR